MVTVVSIVLILAAVPLLVTGCLLISRIMKKIREKDGGAVLRENRRLAAALTALCACYTVGRGLFDYGTKENISILLCLINGVKDVLLPAVCGGVACHIFRKRGLALQEENQLNLGEQNGFDK